MAWEELEPEERAVLCALHRIVGRATGRKPRHAPIGQVMRKLAPPLRDTATVRGALRRLARLGLARRVKGRGGERETWTLTPEGARLAEEKCLELE